MASSDRKPNYNRRFFWFSVSIAILFGGYSATWFWLAGRLETAASAAVARFGQDGRRAECENLVVRGFPFRIGLFCDGVRYEDSGRSLSASAAAFRSAAQVYNPFHIVAELDGPATVTAPGFGPLTVNWEGLKASTVLGDGLPDRASVEADTLSAEGTLGTLTDSALADIDHAEGHMRRNGPDLDLAGSFTDAKVNPDLIKGLSLPPLDGAADMTIRDGSDIRHLDSGSLRGRSGTIRTLALSTGNDAGLAISGPFAFSSEGVLDADFTVAVRNPKALAAQLAQMFPQQASQIETAFMGLAALGDNPSVPLKVSRGKAVLGFIPLGAIPPLPPS